MPAQVTVLCDGLMKLNADFFKKILNIVLSEFEAILLKDTERFGSFEEHSEQVLYLRNLRRTRSLVVPHVLEALEIRLAGIRQDQTNQNQDALSALKKNLNDLELVDSGVFSINQFFSSIAARCESQNNLELHAINQRLAVLAGKAPFPNDTLPLGPHVICTCFQESIQDIELNYSNTETLFSLFEKIALADFHSLLQTCNAFLAGNGILVNLNFTAYRNPELRFKKSPIALKGGTVVDDRKNIVLDGDSTPFSISRQHVPQNPVTETDRASSAAALQSFGSEKFGFEDFRQLLSEKKRILSGQNSLARAHPFHSPSSTDTHSSEGTHSLVGTHFSAGVHSSAGTPSSTGAYSSAETHYSSGVYSSSQNTISASKDIISGILGDYSRSEVPELGTFGGVQRIKQNLQSQLIKMSTQDRELTLAAEDSDAIDIFGMVMDSAINKLKPNSATSQLMAMLQAPLINIILQDKTFFENHMHPARKMLDALAETGMNWLDVTDRDEKLFEKVNTLVSDISKDANADSQKLLATYEETNRLLQSLIKKAEAIERRQIEIVKGKERLIIARERAEKTLDDLIAGHSISEFAHSILRGAWTDVMVLAELRSGVDSQQWHKHKDIASKIIALSDSSTITNDIDEPMTIIAPVEESLQLVGYSSAEAKDVANILLNKHESNLPLPSLAAANNIFSSAPPVKQTLQMLPSHVRIIRELKQLPFGTWFEFQIENEALPERRKMAWASHTTHNMLFVNSRGQKVAEIPMEELAHGIYLGKVKIAKEEHKGFIERTFESVMDSLRDMLPSPQGSIK